MKLFTAYFIALEPLIVSDGTAEGMKHTSLAYVPGSMLLGSLVAKWKQKKSTDGNPTFEKLFMQGDVYWGHVLPVCENRPCVPVPLCWEYIKEYGTLPTYNTQSDISKIQIYNSWHTSDIDVNESITSKDEQREAWKEVVKTHAKRKRITSGFVDLKTLCAPYNNFTRTTHVALDSIKRKAQEGRLFGYEAIAQGTKLCSQILCKVEVADEVRNFLQKEMTLYVGHSRSAGYGALKLQDISETTLDNHLNVQPGDHTLWLTSDYFPKQSWKKPLDAIKDELQEKLGNITWVTEKNFCRDTRLEGFQGLWGMPRATRHGLCAGSVLTFSCEKSGMLPSVLGAWKQEGYGRVSLDATTLKSIRIIPQPIEKQVQSIAENSMKNNWPFLKIWRERSFVRIAEEQAMACIWKQRLWDKFFEDLSTCKVSQNQRGNMRNLISTYPESRWLETYRDILEKQPGRQWKNSIVKPPFATGRRSLDEIMLKFLDPLEIDIELIESCKDIWTLPILAGGDINPNEVEKFKKLRHKRFLLEFLRRWEKEERTKQEEK